MWSKKEVCMARAHKCYHPGVFTILSKDYQFKYNQYATMMILSTCISLLSYMKDNAEKSHIFFFLLRGIWSIVKRTKISKSWFFFKRFWYSVYVRSQHVIIFCEITRYFIVGVLKFLLPLYNFTVNVGFYAAVRMF